MKVGIVEIDASRERGRREDPPGWSDMGNSTSFCLTTSGSGRFSVLRAILECMEWGADAIHVADASIVHDKDFMRRMLDAHMTIGCSVVTCRDADFSEPDFAPLHTCVFFSQSFHLFWQWAHMPRSLEGAEDRLLWGRLAHENLSIKYVDEPLVSSVAHETMSRELIHECLHWERRAGFRIPLPITEEQRKNAIL